MSDLFDQFWRAYPRRVGKGAAEKAFDKLKVNDGLLKDMLLALEAQKRYRLAAKNSGEFIPDWCHPSTWLNQQRWLDEIPSHAELKERRARKECIVEGCSEPIHAEKDAKQYCYHHYSFDSSGSLRGGLLLVEQLRTYYREHKEIHDLRGQAALKYVRYKIRQIGK